MHYFYGFVTSMSVMTFSIVVKIPSIGADNDRLSLTIHSKESYVYRKMSLSLFTFAPTALLHSEEFENLNNTSLLRKINRQCVEDSRYYVNAVWNKTEGALSMFHASGKISIDESTNFMITSDGINVQHDPGLFDKCIASSIASGRIKGQHCTVFLNSEPLNGQHNICYEPKVTLAARQIHPFVAVIVADSVIGFCLPSSCSAKDLRTAVAHIIGRTSFKKKNKNGTENLHSIVTSNHDRLCHTEIKIQDQSSLDASCAFFIIIICSIGVLLFYSTLHESGMVAVLGPYYQNAIFVRILHCFSVLRNTKDWLSTDSSSDDISCLHGIRVLSLFGIICFHIGEQLFRHPSYNKSAMAQFASTWYGQLIANSSIIVDTFFLMGGLLAWNSLLKDFDRGRFSFYRFYFHRYLRITPLYAGILWFLAALSGRLGSGPDWNLAQYQSEDCRSYWWSNLLYINNFIPSSSTFCMPATWYLAADMQMYIFSPMIVYPLWRLPIRIGPICIAILLISSYSYSTAVYLALDLPPTFMGTRPSMMMKIADYYQIYYVNPLARCPPYLIGILLGWILHQTKDSKVYFKKETLLVGWILSTSTSIVIIYCLFPYLDEERVPVIDFFFCVIYGVFHRTLWATAVAWIIFICVKGYGGKVNDLLSNKIFVPLSKLCFAAYLIHYSLIEHYISHFRTPFYFTTVQLIVTYLGMVVVTLFTSVFLIFAIEMPIRNLEKVILPGGWKIALSPIIKSKSTKIQ